MASRLDKAQTTLHRAAIDIQEATMPIRARASAETRD